MQVFHVKMKVLVLKTYIINGNSHNTSEIPKFQVFTLISQADVLSSHRQGKS